MAIAAIKYVEHNHPRHAKYRILYWKLRLSQLVQRTPFWNHGFIRHITLPVALRTQPSTAFYGSSICHEPQDFSLNGRKTTPTCIIVTCLLLLQLLLTHLLSFFFIKPAFHHQLLVMDAPWHYLHITHLPTLT